MVPPYLLMTWAHVLEPDPQVPSFSWRTWVQLRKTTWVPEALQLPTLSTLADLLFPTSIHLHYSGFKPRASPSTTFSNCRSEPMVSHEGNAVSCSIYKIEKKTPKIIACNRAYLKKLLLELYILDRHTELWCQIFFFPELWSDKFEKYFPWLFIHRTFHF